MHILQSWKEALSLFRPSNFKLFFLVTVKACITAVVTMITYWWWLILLYWSQWFFWSEESFYGAGLATSALRAMLLILFLCCLRAATPLKNYRYFWRMLLKIWYLIPITLLFFWIGSEIPFIPTVWHSLFYFVWTALALYIFTLYLLFVLDSDGSCSSATKSITRAGKMFIYNLPWFLTVNVCFALFELIAILLSFFIAQFSVLGAVVGSELITNLLYSFELTLIVNFYIKRLYDQLEVYFKLP